jgi:hypothetical protein
MAAQQLPTVSFSARAVVTTDPVETPHLRVARISSRPVQSD